jgi:hypothetical protein
MPFKSQAQHKAMFAKAGRGELPKEQVREWARKTKKKLGKGWAKKLPKKAKKG